MDILAPNQHHYQILWTQFTRKVLGEFLEYAHFSEFTLTIGGTRLVTSPILSESWISHFGTLQYSHRTFGSFV